MMKCKGSELSPLGTFEGKVPRPVMDKVAARQKEILAGSFTVKVDDSQPKGSGEVGGAPRRRPGGRWPAIPRISTIRPDNGGSTATLALRGGCAEDCAVA